jgi:hypothetical protein
VASNHRTRLKVYLSHSSKDVDLTDKIHEWLTNQSFIDEVWIDNIELKTGDYLMEKIQHGVRSSNYLIPLITENSVKSNWVRKEVKQALREESKNKIKVIPVLHRRKVAPYLKNKKYKIPSYLKNKKYVSVDSELNGIYNIIPSILNCQILPIRLASRLFQLNEQKLISVLSKFSRSNRKQCYFYLETDLDNQLVKFIRSTLRSYEKKQGAIFHSERRLFSSFQQ